MMTSIKQLVLAGSAVLALSAVAPYSFLSGSAAVAQTAAAAEVDEDTSDEPDDEGQPDDGDGDVTNDDMTEVMPDADDRAQWSDVAEDDSEKQAEQVDDDNYVKNCSDSALCQATLNYVEQKLSQMLSEYSEKSTRKRRELPPPKNAKLGTTKYRVLPGQKLEIVSGKVGVNDRLLWSQVTKVIPRAQSDRLMSAFWVFYNKADDTLAYVQGNDDDNMFRLGINEPTHLATDLENQFLTVSHELMHLIVMDQAVGDSTEAAGPQDEMSRKLSVKKLLEALFGAGSRAKETANNESDAQVAGCTGVSDDDDVCYPSTTIYTQFVRKFWSKSDLENHQNEDFYDKNESRFVTQYSTTGPHEDIAESFAYWVIAEGKGKTVADSKQRFFGRFPQLVALKSHIRRAVIADILKSQAAEKQ